MCPLLLLAVVPALPGEQCEHPERRGGAAGRRGGDKAGRAWAVLADTRRGEFGGRATLDCGSGRKLDDDRLSFAKKERRRIRRKRGRDAWRVRGPAGGVHA
jgi:hypothetical protein